MGKGLFIQKTILKLKVSLPDSESIVYSKYYDVVIKEFNQISQVYGIFENNSTISDCRYLTRYVRTSTAMNK